MVHLFSYILSGNSDNVILKL